MTCKVDTPKNVWSATPTPFTDEMKIDVASVERLVEHHINLGITGLFLLGTCGEGAWMTDAQRRELVSAVVKFNDGRLRIAVQVTDNSAPRIIDNMNWVAETGADIAVIAGPYFMGNPTPARIQNLYMTAIDQSPLPVGIYDRGNHDPVPVPAPVMAEICMNPKVVLIKDSSSDLSRRDLALENRAKRSDILLLDGDEFHCVDYMIAGYDGLLLGGGIFNGYMAGQIINAVKAGEYDRAREIQTKMNNMMFDVFGGRTISCWLSGQKRLLVEMGVFSTWKSYLEYPLNPECEQAIIGTVAENADVLFPWK